MNQGREEKCLQTLARLRNASVDDIRVRVEFLEIKALRDSDDAILKQNFPQYQDQSRKSRSMIGYKAYTSLITDPALRKRTAVA